MLVAFNVMFAVGNAYFFHKNKGWAMKAVAITGFLCSVAGASIGFLR